MRYRPVLGSQTFELVTAVIERAQRTGANVPTRLHDAGLLWTPEREANTRANAMKFVLDEAQAWTAVEFLRLTNRTLESATPAEMRTSILKWIETHVDHARGQR